MTVQTLRRGEAQTMIPADALLDAIERHYGGGAIIDCPECGEETEVDLLGTVDLGWLQKTITDLIDKENR